MYFVLYYFLYKTPRPYIRNSDQQFHNWRRHQCSLSARCTGVYIKIKKTHCFFVTNRACINLRIMFLKDICWFLLFNTYRYLKMQFKKFEFSYRKKIKFYHKCISLLKGIQIWYVSIFSISKTINITQQDLTDELTCETNNTKILILTQFKLCLL